MSLPGCSSASQHPVTLHFCPIVAAEESQDGSLSLLMHVGVWDQATLGGSLFTILILTLCPSRTSVLQVDGWQQLLLLRPDTTFDLFICALSCPPLLLIFLSREYTDAASPPYQVL